MRFSAFIFVIMCSFFSTTAFSFEQGRLPPEMIASFKKEKPMTQKDIDLFLKVMPQVQKLKDKENPSEEFFIKNGTTGKRFAYIGTKVALGYNLLDAPAQQQAMFFQITGTDLVMKPTDAEFELIRKNKSKIAKFM